MDSNILFVFVFLLTLFYKVMNYLYVFDLCVLVGCIILVPFGFYFYFFINMIYILNIILLLGKLLQVYYSSL